MRAVTSPATSPGRRAGIFSGVVSVLYLGLGLGPGLRRFGFEVGHDLCRRGVILVSFKMCGLRERVSGRD